MDFPVPEDEIEQERLELQHQLFLMTFEGKLCLSPIQGDPKNVLDLGTGTGTWAMYNTWSYTTDRTDFYTANSRRSTQTQM